MRSWRSSSGSLDRPAAAWIAIGACALLHLVLLAPYVHHHEHDFDAIHLYYPLAERLSELGLRFFLTEPSIHAPPFGYVYPALLGLPVESMHRFNFVLSIGTLLMAARAAWLMYSPAAGVATALAFAASPLLRPFLATTLTEPEYLFLSAAWIWTFAQWRHGGRDRYIVASSFALVLAALTRAVSFYPFVAMLAIFAILAARERFDRRAPATRALLAYGFAALVPLAFTLKNWIVFGYPFYATGGGNALYLGNNPVTGGYDPNYLGIQFDVGEIARDESQLTLHAERLLRGVGEMLVAQSSLAELAMLHARKLAAFVFVTNAESHASLLRGWRIATLVLSAVGLLRVRDVWLSLAVAGTAVCLTLVHVPLLYTHRYSVGSLDLWLTIGAGIGIAAACAWPWRRIAALAALLAGACAVGTAFARLGGRPVPDYLRGARLSEWKAAPLSRALSAGIDVLDIPVATTRPYYQWQDHVLWLSGKLTRTGPGDGCDRADVSFDSSGSGAWKFVASFAPRDDGQQHDYFVRGIPLPNPGNGTLRLSFRCSGGAHLALDRIEVFSPVGAVGWREQYLHEKPYFAVPLDPPVAR